MRKQFSEFLHKEMSINSDIVLLTGDLGYGLWDRIKIDYPDRFFDVGSSEQLMIGCAAGMALEGKVPVVYYGYLGFTHWSDDDEKIMSCFENINFFKPKDLDEMILNSKKMIYSNSPCYLNLRRK